MGDFGPGVLLAPPPTDTATGAAGAAAAASSSTTGNKAIEAAYAPGEPDFRRILTFVFQSVDELLLEEAARGRMPPTAG